MTTAINLITRALTGTGSLDAGEEPDYDTSATGLYLLNDLLDSWSLDRLYVFQAFKESFALVSGTSQYAIGSGAAFNTTRPTMITKAFLRVSSTDHPVSVLDDSGFANIVSKTTATGYPEFLNYNPTMPTGTINLWPVPQADQTLHIESPRQLTSFTTLTTDVTLAPGYSEAIRLALMQRMAAEGLGKVSQLHIDLTNESIARLKTRNSKVPILHTQMAATKQGNIYNGFM
jgi:hypothetical protein